MHLILWELDCLFYKYETMLRTEATSRTACLLPDFQPGENGKKKQGIISFYINGC